MPFEKTGIIGMPDAEMFRALQVFQKEQNIPATGIIRPKDDTVQALNREISKQKTGQYIWHTVGDSRVREGHAELDGLVRNWEDSPDPAEEFNCRCWAESVEEKEEDDDEGTLFPDAIRPTVSPLDFIGGGLLVKGTSGVARRLVTSRLRDTSWIRNAPRKQLQKKFKHAKKFDVKGNMNNKTLAQYQKALEDHVKSPDTKIIKGTYRKQSVTHYYNSKTKINVMQDKQGEFISGWKLDEDQIISILTRGSL